MSHPAVFGFRLDIFYPDDLGPASTGRSLVAGLSLDAAHPVPDVRCYLHREHQDGAAMQRYVVRDQDGVEIGSVNGFGLVVARVIQYAHEEVMRDARARIGLPRYADDQPATLPVPAEPRA